MSTPRLAPDSPAPAADGAARRGMSNLAKMLGGRLGAQVVLALSVFVIARRMGAETYGLYAGVLAVIAILQAASSGGLQMVEVRLLAPLWQAGRRREAVTLGSTIWGSRVLLSAAAGLIAFLWLGRSGEVAGGGALLLGLFCFLRSSYEAARSLLLPVGHAGTLILFELLRAGSTLPLVLVAFTLAGLDAVFAAFALFYGLMLAACYRLLYSILPVGFGSFRWSVLAPHMGYAFSSFVATLALIVQAQFAVYALAHWVTGSAAAFLGLAVQFFALGQGIILTCQRALLPVLAELEAGGERERLAAWGGRMLRASAAATCLAAVGWALTGREIVRWLLGEAFAPVYPCVAWILVAAVFYGLAEACAAVLYVRGLARPAAASTLLFSATTIAGLVWVLRRGEADAALEVCRLYALAAAIFFLAAYCCLGLLDRLRLPLAKALALALPMLLVFPALAAELSPLLSWALAALWAPLYLVAASRLGLLPLEEGRRLYRALRRGRTAARSRAAGN